MSSITLKKIKFFQENYGQITDEFDNNLQVLRKVADPPKEMEEEIEEDERDIKETLNVMM